MMQLRIDHVTALVMLASLVLGCMATPSPSPAPSPSVVMQDGIRFELLLDRSEAFTGERITALVRIANESDRVIYRDVAGGQVGEPDPRCTQVASVTAIEPGSDPTPGFISPERRFSPPGDSVACPAMALPRPLDPGMDAAQQMVWDVSDSLPDGADALTIRATFRYYLDEDGDAVTVDVEAPLSIVR